MKTIFKLTALLAAAIALTACEHEAVETITPHSVEYIMSSHGVPTSTATVSVDSRDDLDALLDRFCDYTMQGKFIAFHSNKAPRHATKEPTYFSTTSREEIKRWMAHMEDEGLTVTVNYDPSTGTWNGMAYANVTGGTASAHRRLERATMDLDMQGHEIHAVFTYFWNGDRLTEVDMVNGTVNEHYNYTHYRAALAYSDSLRTAIHFYGIGGELVDSYLYTYQDGRLCQEQQNSNTYTYHYNADGELENWDITPGYNSLLPHGISCEWEDGNVVRTYNQYGQLIDNYEYDDSPHPYGVTLGTTTLLPGYHAHIAPETQWSRHNLARVLDNTNNQGTSLQISYTYDELGYPVAATTEWYGAASISWTFEYYDE